MDNLFRYLEKYVGTYRVLAPYDLDYLEFPTDENGKLAESFDDLYIPCVKGVIKATYRDQNNPILCVYFESGQQGRNVYKELQTKYKKLWLEEEDIGSYDYYIYFRDEDIKKVATIVKPRTYGAKIKPYSVKNLPKNPYEIPEEEDAKYDDIVKDLPIKDKMLFSRSIMSEFDAVIQKKKGKKYDVKQERTKSKLNGRKFIHSIGLWDEYIKFAQEKYDKEYGNK